MRFNFFPQISTGINRARNVVSTAIYGDEKALKSLQQRLTVTQQSLTDDKLSLTESDKKNLLEVIGKLEKAITSIADRREEIEHDIAKTTEWYSRQSTMDC